MSEKDIDQYLPSPPPPEKRGWSLGTAIMARKSLAKLIREFKNNPDPKKIPEFRALIYGLQSLLQFFKFEKDCEIEKVLEEIKERLDMQ